MASAGFELTGEATPLRELARDLWASRALIAMLARKDFFVRYRRASFGLLWAVGLPLFQAVVLAVVFSQVARVKIPGVPYTVFLFAGMVSWSFFSSCIASGSTAIVDGHDLTTKIYFPRAVLPLVTIGGNLYGFFVSACLLLGMAVVFGVGLGAHTLLLLPAIALMAALAISFCLVFSGLHVYFRDVRYLVAAMLIAWFYVTPIIYPLTKAGRLAKWLKINPMTGVVEMFRAATVGADPGWATCVWWTLGWIAVLSAIALYIFRRFNRVFVDLL